MPPKYSHSNLAMALSQHSIRAVYVTVSVNREFFEDVCVPSTRASLRGGIGT